LAMLWVAAFLFAGTFAISIEPKARSVFYTDLVSLVTTIGAAIIFYAWAKQDAPEYNVSQRAVLWFSVSSVLLIFLSYFGYLLYSRGLRRGTVALLKLSAFLIALFFTLSVIWLQLLFEAQDEL
jgi:drug/metabolite transporter (DMT)-like permease